VNGSCPNRWRFTPHKPVVSRESSEGSSSPLSSLSSISNQRRNSLDSTTTEGFQRRDKELETFLADSSANIKLKGISTDSQVCSAFYSAKQSAAPSQTSHNNHEEEGVPCPSLFFIIVMLLLSLNLKKWVFTILTGLL
jgi:hypothetical protein